MTTAPARGPTAALAERLRPLGLLVEVEPCLPSTSDFIKARLAAEGGLPGPCLVATQDQNAGRGTRGRDWQMEPGRDLAMTLALPLSELPGGPEGLPEPRLPLLAAAAVAASLSQHKPGLPAIGLRWPNDLLLIPPVAKVCGLLLESTHGWLLCGVGLNVNSRRNLEQPSAQSGFRACSLRDATGRHYDLDELAAELAAGLLRALRDRHGVEHWLREWSFRDVSAGGRYRWQGPEGPEELRAEGVDLATGALRLRSGQGREVLVSSYQDLERLSI